MADESSLRDNERVLHTAEFFEPLVVLLLIVFAGVIAAGATTNVVNLDSDSLTPIQEYNSGTSMFDSDTDADGLPDDREIALGTDPTVTDTDGDGLNDTEEVQVYGTDPIASDTDNDGLSDGLEVNNPSNLYPNADPLRKDIYVEIDEMKDQKLPKYEAQKIVESYATAPIDNPDGSEGITLHLLYNETIPKEESTHKNQLDELSEEYFDRKKTGYHYMVVVKNVHADNGNPKGSAVSGFMIVEDSSNIRDYTASIAMHELGHSVRVGARKHPGGDSARYPFSEYPSVMNYNSPRDTMDYSDGGASPNDFDDWQHIEDNLYTPPTSRSNASQSQT